MFEVSFKPVLFFPSIESSLKSGNSFSAPGIKKTVLSQNRRKFG